MRTVLFMKQSKFGLYCSMGTLHIKFPRATSAFSETVTPAAQFIRVMKPSSPSPRGLAKTTSSIPSQLSYDGIYNLSAIYIIYYVPTDGHTGASTLLIIGQDMIRRSPCIKPPTASFIFGVFRLWELMRSTDRLFIS